MAGKSPKEKFIDCVWERMDSYDEEEEVARVTCSYITSSSAPPPSPLPSSTSPLTTSSSSSSSASGLGPEVIRTSPAPDPWVAPTDAPAPEPTTAAGDDHDSGYK